MAECVSERPDSTVTSGRAERRVRSIYVERCIISSDRYDLTYEIKNMTRGAHWMVAMERPNAVGVWSGRTGTSGHPDFVLCSEPNSGAPI
jgi:hypothetical protein